MTMIDMDEDLCKIKLSKQKDLEALLDGIAVVEV